LDVRLPIPTEQEEAIRMRYQVERLCAIVAISLCGPLAVAQTSKEPPQMTPEQQAEMEAYMKAGTPGPPHQLMAASVGTYDLKIKSWYEPGGPAVEESGTAKRSMLLGGRVMAEEMDTTMMGMPFSGYGLMGFDNVSGKYWHTWNDSMSTGVMVSEGTCDADGNACSFTGSWNDAIKKASVTARMTSRRTGRGTEVLEMFAPGRDGKEMKMMEITYTKR
jgi:hypothetical protein